MVLSGSTLVVFEVQRECLEGPVAAVASESRRNVWTCKRRHTITTITTTTTTLPADSLQFLLFQIGIRSRIFPCHTVSWFIDTFSSSSSRHVQKIKSSRQSDRQPFFAPTKAGCTDRSCRAKMHSRDLENRASSSVNELKIPD